MTASYTFVGAGKPEEKDVSCDVDEWPPAYFRDAKNHEQRARLLPGSENKGAGSLWTDFCLKHDGGKGNGQYVPKKNPALLNKDLAKAVGNSLGSSTKKNKPAQGAETTTTYISYAAEFTRAVFSMTFDFAGADIEGGKPSEGNLWGLDINPCWPKAMIDDPGWCIDIDDPWYKTHPTKHDRRQLYAERPTDEMFARAYDWVEHNPDEKLIGHHVGTFDTPDGPKREHSDGEEEQPPKKKVEPGSKPQRRRRSLHDLLEEPLTGHDNFLNGTADKGQGGIRRDLQPERCSRACQQDEIQSHQAGYLAGRLIARRRGLRVSPAENVAADVTMTAGLDAEQEVRTLLRRTATAPSPAVMTGSP